MFRNGWILFLILLCVAFFISCGKNSETEIEHGELVKMESETGWDTARFHCIMRKFVDRADEY